MSDITAKFRLVPEEKLEALIAEASTYGSGKSNKEISERFLWRDKLKSLLATAPPMDYISGEEIRKLVAKWREKATHCDEMSLQTTNDSHALALRSKSIHLQLCSDELEKLLKGEGQ